jgi:hypothetical protein
MGRLAVVQGEQRVEVDLLVAVVQTLEQTTGINKRLQTSD